MVNSVERTLDILEELSGTTDSVSLTQLHAVLGLPLGTLHRLLSTLIKRGYASQDKETRRYGPGPKLLEVAACATSNSCFNLRLIACPFLQQLTGMTGETSNLVVLQELDGVYMDQAASPRLVRMFTEVGRRAPLYCTGAGKAILSGFAPYQLDAYLATTELKRWTPRTVTSPKRLRSEIKRTQQRGFAIDNEEREEGVCCVAAPIFNHAGICVAAVSVSGPKMRMDHQRAFELGPLVRRTAYECSVRLGYSVPAEVPGVA